ncbi:hypothetical protein LMH87_003968 [Akanthomyces muscarius]|uniref:Uncharacterized protein n=1 Tax=Akanthomyces muscarius TaxID=2231603 RepID=A0A9W8UH66_AKAMU|nr:hypothetical protein LMH87_003968 [Akanthomyces muscarius]KAJ4145108.1 hypothetical protein LMH87_003968 [Akanthomyces muscarius]
MSRLLHIVFLLVAALAFCLTAQQLHNVNDMVAARGLDRQQLQQRDTSTTSGFIKAQRPTSVWDAPPAAQAAETSTAGDEDEDEDDASMSSRDTNGGSLTDDDELRPTKVKTPAIETVLPTNTKVPVAVSAASTSLSDPGFLALVASLGLMTLGMALV